MSGKIGLVFAIIIGLGAWLTLKAPASVPYSGSNGSDYAPQSSHDTIIRTPAAPRVLTDLLDANGASVTVSCSTCHSTRTPNAANRQAEDLDEFHQGMQFQHGSNSCLSCHNAADYDSLRRADGSSLAFGDVMQLCAQCHGSQFRDYQHGAHGGMIGHWDLRKGPRQRKNCIDCHDPHAPKFQPMLPATGPRDRFKPVKHHHSTKEEK